jgi:septal ring factor EnvC (AmiA/AmiB activator)
MISDELARQLHDRATRGDELSADELAQLEHWYALQDSAESDVLGLTAAEKTSATLRARIDATLAQLMAVTKHIQELTAENEVLRREITALRHQLVQAPTQQPA